MTRIIKIAAMAVAFTICANIIFESILNGAEYNLSLFSDRDDTNEVVYCSAAGLVDINSVNLNVARNETLQDQAQLTASRSDVVYTQTGGAVPGVINIMSYDAPACESPSCTASHGTTSGRVQTYVAPRINSVNQGVIRRRRIFRPIGRVAVAAARLPVAVARPAVRASAVAVRSSARVARLPVRASVRAVRLPIRAVGFVRRARPVARIIRPVGRLFR